MQLQHSLQPLWRPKLQGDRGIWLVTLLLLLLGQLAVYSSSSTLAFRFHGGNTERYLLSHLALTVMGLVCLYLVHRLDYRVFARLSTPLLVAAVLLSIYTLFQGQELEMYGANRWISVFGVSFQPSDLAKFALMLHLAHTLTRRQEIISDFRQGFVPVIGVVGLVCGSIGPANLSTALLIFTCSLLLMYVAGIKLRYLMAVVLVGLIGLLLLFQFSSRAATWKSRLGDFQSRMFDPTYEPSYQTVQSYVAISQGGMLGQGAGKSLQRHYLPQPFSDFIFAIIVEEYGLLGALFVMALYLTLLVRTIAIVTVSKTFGALLAAGLGFLIVMQAFINMAVTVGILPVTGLPLPLVSMGGTSLLFTCLSIGVILSVSREVGREAQPAQPAKAQPIPAV